MRAPHPTGVLPPAFSSPATPHDATEREVSGQGVPASFSGRRDAPPGRVRGKSAHPWRGKRNRAVSQGVSVRRREPIEVLNTTATASTLRFQLDDRYAIEERKVDGERVTVVSHPESETLKDRDRPQLPCFRVNLIIPTDSVPVVRLEESSHHDVAAAPPAVSAGFVSREDIEIRKSRSLRPFTGSSPFPKSPVRLTDPYKVRHVRGVGVIVHPFQYHPESDSLRIYDRLTIKVTTESEAAVQREPDLPARFHTRAFSGSATYRFANAHLVFEADRGIPLDPSDSRQSLTVDGERQTSPSEDSSAPLLLVAPETYAGALDEFLQWKRQRGLQITMLQYPTDTGSGSANLAAEIKSRYETDNTAYVILVGDHDDIPVQTLSPNPSDTVYTLVSGDDYYHDLFISRLSANSVQDLQVQARRIIDYERDPLLSDGTGWYRKAALVGSDEGEYVSAFGLRDWEILNQERDKLLTAGFTQIDRIYDPGATTSDVVTSWNAGRTLFYYLGHGTETSWNTTGFGVTNVRDSLHNSGMFPFIVNGNCENGQFTYAAGDCLAEAMVKAGTVTDPRGSIGVLASTTNMDWDPPIVMIREFSDLLTSGGAETAGAAGTFSVQAAMDYCYTTPDEGAAAAERIMEQVHLFGDCTLGIRTRSPVALDVTHPSAVVMDQAFPVSVESPASGPMAGVTVCLYRESDGAQFTGTTDENGDCVLQPSGLYGDTNPFLLTVFERNAIPYQKELDLQQGGLVIWSPATLDPAYIGQDYAFEHKAIGGQTPYEWDLSGNSPAWMTLSRSTGMATGQPIAAETYTYQVEVTDAEETTASQVVTLTAGYGVTFQSVAVPDGMVESSYDAVIRVDGTFSPLEMRLDSGQLPPGLSLSSTGTVRGIPTRAGDYSFTVRASDRYGDAATQRYEIGIAPSPSVTIDVNSPLPVANRGEPYSISMNAHGGSGGGYSWSVISGALPPGMSLTPSGTLSGTPTSEDIYTFEVRVEDDSTTPLAAEKQLALTVESSVYFTSSRLPYAYSGVPFEAQVPVAGSYRPFSFDASQENNYETSTESTSFATTGTDQVWNLDENEWELSFGFSFPFFGDSYASCRVGDNGYLVFGQSSPDPKWDATPSQLESHALIAPFWTDLLILPEYPDTGIFVERNTGSVTVRWRGRDFHHEDDIVNMAVTLYESGRIRFQYGSIETTNRVIVGISGGSAEATYQLYMHSWDELSPDPVEGWSFRDDILFHLPAALPPWLNLSPDGTLSGVPTSDGTYAFSIQATDAEGHTAVGDLTLEVLAPDPADTDGDGTVDNKEILAYVDEWAAGHVPLAVLESTIETWRSGTASRKLFRSSEDPLLPRRPLPIRQRTGDILVCEIDVDDMGVLTEFAALGYDVAGHTGQTVTLYATPAEVQALREAGYTLEILDRQYVPHISSEPPTPRTDRSPPAGYTDYAGIEAQLQAYAEDHSHVCRLESVGQSVQGRELWALCISDNPASDEAEPEFRYISTMHGDEPLGTEMTLRFIDLLISSYGGADAQADRITELVNQTEIWVLPCMNPDGLEAGTRYNANGYDLNRGFPDGVATDLGTAFAEPNMDVSGRQPETAAVMQWSRQHAFTLAANFHTGALLVCYPFGNNPQHDSVDSPTPDDHLFEELSWTYASANPHMTANSPYPDGITNAAAWYVAAGEMADWSYRYLGLLETTVELNKTKAPPGSEIGIHWEWNREAMLRYAEASRDGLHGRVIDAASGEPLEARIRVADNPAGVFTDPEVGDYHRLLLPGTYDVRIDKPGYWTHTVESVTVVSRDRQGTLDAALTRCPHALEREFPTAYPLPDGTVRVDMQVDLDETDPPNAFIIDELIPAGWSYVAGSTLDGNGTSLAEPRRDGRSLSWLVWGDLIGDMQLSYRLMPPADNTQRGVFDGDFIVSAGRCVTDGARVWQRTTNQVVTLDLSRGWNLVSLPVTIDAPGPETVFAAEEVSGTVWAWNGTGYYRPAALVPGNGYWVYAAEQTRVQVAGLMPVQTTRNFSAGWNLFGPLVPGPVSDFPGLSGAVYRYNGRSYLQSTDLTVGAGYWTYLTSPVQIDLAAPSRDGETGR